MNRKYFLFLLIAFALTTEIGRCEESAPGVDEKIEESARLRLYPGGIDEQPLQVQPSLAQPSRLVESSDLQRASRESEKKGDENQGEADE